MDSYLFLFLFLFSFIFHLTESLPQSSQLSQCSHGNPSVQFPFWIKNQQLQSQNQSNFELFCRENQTMIHFPRYGDLAVRSISYDAKRMNLVDPKNCVHEVFLNLDLSSTPFRYFYALKNYTYINCSAPLPPTFSEIPCLSGSGYHVHTVETSLDVPGSCRRGKTVAIPFSYNPYISDNTFGLGLVWGFPECDECEAKNAWNGFFPDVAEPVTKSHRTKTYTVLGIGFCGITLIALMIIKLWQHNKSEQKEEEDQLAKLISDKLCNRLRKNRKEESSEVV